MQHWLVLMAKGTKPRKTGAGTGNSKVFSSRGRSFISKSSSASSKTPQYKPPVLQYKGLHCFLDLNPPELANSSELAKEMSNPLCLVELYRNLPKEYQSPIPEHPPLLPLQSPQLPVLPPQACNVEQVTTNDLETNKLTPPI